MATALNYRVRIPGTSAARKAGCEAHKSGSVVAGAAQARPGYPIASPRAGPSSESARSWSRVLLPDMFEPETTRRPAGAEAGVVRNAAPAARGDGRARPRGTRPVGSARRPRPRGRDRAGAGTRARRATRAPPARPRRRARRGRRVPGRSAIAPRRAPPGDATGEGRRRERRAGCRPSWRAPRSARASRCSPTRPRAPEFGRPCGERSKIGHLSEADPVNCLSAFSSCTRRTRS
jgi:hypothetical protein